VIGYFPFSNCFGHIGIFFPLPFSLPSSLFAEAKETIWEEDVVFDRLLREVEEVTVSEVWFKSATTSGSKSEKLAPELDRAVTVSRRVEIFVVPVMLLRIEISDEMWIGAASAEWRTKKLRRARRILDRGLRCCMMEYGSSVVVVVKVKDSVCRIV
jgi:hypothetical protein